MCHARSAFNMLDISFVVCSYLDLNMVRRKKSTVAILCDEIHISSTHCANQNNPLHRMNNKMATGTFETLCFESSVT